MALVKYNNNSISAVTSAASIPNGALTLIKTLTASSSSTLSFVHGSSDVVLDGTYPIYKFSFINIHPSANDKGLQFNMSTDSGSNYNVTKTTTSFRSRHAEDNSYAVLEYRTGEDLAQSTDYQYVTAGQGNENDEDGAGELFLFSPSSTTFVKHFMSRSTSQFDRVTDTYCAGYFNTTSAINAMQFKFNSGNIDAGSIKLYGVS